MTKLPRLIAQAGLEVISRFLAVLGQDHTAGSLYRGHATAGHDPKPKSFRNNVEYLDCMETLNMWKKFINRVAPVRPHNDMEYLILAQHYGVVTALLDWTSNPLVALFFACGEDHANTGEVWQLESHSLREFHHLTTVDPFRQSRPLPIVVDAGVMNPRSRVQYSMMTLHTKGEQRPAMRSIFSVEPAEKMLALHALRLFGISPESLFEDPERAAKDFQEGLSLNNLGPDPLS